MLLKMQFPQALKLMRWKKKEKNTLTVFPYFKWGKNADILKPPNNAF